MNPYTHFTPEILKLLFASLASHSNHLISRKIEFTKSGFEPEMKNVLIKKCDENIKVITEQMQLLRRATNEPLKLS